MLSHIKVHFLVEMKAVTVADLKRNESKSLHFLQNDAVKLWRKAGIFQRWCISNNIQIKGV